MVRVIIAVVLTACVQFAWGFTFHGPMRSLDHMTNRVPDDAALSAALASSLPESGTYFAPMCPGSNVPEEQRQAR